MRAETGWVARLDGAFFVLAGLASVWFAYLTLEEGITPGWQMLLVIVFWVLVAYLVLPRIHPHPHPHLRARLLHRTHAHCRRPAR